MKSSGSALLDWLDHRTGFRAIRKHLLDEPLPAGTGWWFTLGSVLLFGLGVQVVTGIALALYYAPTPDHAWDSVRYITTDVRGGRLLRGLHHYGASVVVVAALAHLVRVVCFGSYRKPREVNWIVGLLLLQVILAFGLTGYLLPWDQRAYWATVVTINISKLTPGLGEAIAAVLRGGSEIGALTLTRWYAAHVLVLPPVLLGLTVVHLYLMRRHGISGPVRPKSGPSQTFFPYQASRDLTMAVIVGVVLTALAWKGAPALEPPADPTSSDYIPRPEWYFLGLFQLLKYFPGRLEVVGALVIPGIVMTWLALLPWLDRGRTREWRARRVVLGLFTAGLAALVTLTVLGALDKPPQDASQWTIRELGGAHILATSERCTRCHGPEKLAAAIEPGRIRQAREWIVSHVNDPEVIAPGVRAAPESNQYETTAIIAALARLRASAPPVLAEPVRQVYGLISQHCLECHLIDGVGGTEGPELTHVGKDQDAGMIERRLVDPFSMDPGASMPAFVDTLTPEQMRLLAVWLAGRK